MSLAHWAGLTARDCLKGTLTRRWAHVQGVASLAGRLAQDLELKADVDSLISAAWLHDVGCSPNLLSLGFHPIDGASFLRQRGFPARIVNLVAFHSGAEFEAKELGLDRQLEAFVDERSLIRDLLWYVDLTVGPDGQRLTFPARMDEIRERYPPDHYVARALGIAMGERELAIERVEFWIAQVSQARA